MAENRDLILRLDIQGDKQLQQLQRNFDKTREALKKVNKQQRDGIITSEQASKARASLNLQLKANRNALNDQQAALLKNNNALRKNSGFVAGVRKGVGQWATSMIGMAAIIGVTTRAISSATKTIKEFDEGVANLAKTTGLAKNDARDLAKELLKIDTRTSVNDLLELGSAAGRLGLEGQGLVDFTREADRAFVALGDSLEGSAEDIALTLGKLGSAFGIEEEFGVGESISKIGSVVNELGATTKASEGPIIDFTKRLSGVSAQAGVSLPDLAALGALFDANGQSMEVAATTFAKLLPALGKDVEEFSKVAGLSVDEFSELLRDKPFEALKAVADGAKSTDRGLIGLSDTLSKYGIDSARAAGIVTLLSENTEQLTEFQKTANTAFEEGTSLADEFAIKNDTLNAKTEKLVNAWDKFILAIEDGDNVLSGVFGTIADGITKILSGTTELLDFNFDSASQGFNTYLKALTGVDFELGKTTESTKELTEAEKENAALAKKRAALDKVAARKRREEQEAKLKEQEQADKEEEKRDTEKIQKKADREKAAADKEIEDKLKRQEELQRQLDEAKAQAIIDEEEREKELARLAFENKIAKLTENSEVEIELKSQLKRNLEQELANIDAEFRLKEEEELQKSRDKIKKADLKAIKEQEELNKLDFKLKQDKLNAAADLATALAGLAKRGSVAQKLLASTGAIINTYAGAAAALAPPPIGAGPILGPVLAATTIATGLKSVATINGVQFADGGKLVGDSHAQGGIPFTIGGRAGFEAEGGEVITYRS
jgi:TP901 family phage tail tape measure protein